MWLLFPLESLLNTEVCIYSLLPSSPLPFFLAIDFLAKYCIFSQEKLAEYKRAFEAVSERGFKPSLFTLCLRYTPSFFLVFCLSLSLDLTLSLSFSLFLSLVILTLLT